MIQFSLDTYTSTSPLGSSIIRGKITMGWLKKGETLEGTWEPREENEDVGLSLPKWMAQDGIWRHQHGCRPCSPSSCLSHFRHSQTGCKDLCDEVIYISFYDEGVSKKRMNECNDIRRRWGCPNEPQIPYPPLSSPCLSLSFFNHLKTYNHDLKGKRRETRFWSSKETLRQTWDHK